MASNHKNAFPHFVPNQLLKSSTLNGYFAFLDEQTRLSRVHLLGCGIVDGLDFSDTGSALVVSPGVAVNKDGWLVQVPEATEYRFVVEAPFSEDGFQSSELGELVDKGGSRIARVCFRTEEDAEEFGKEASEIIPFSDVTLDDYVVALAFGTRPEHAVRCAHDHCDLNTSEQILEAWPVLIPLDGLPSLFQKMAPMNWAVPTRKEPAFEFYHGVVDVFNEQVRSSALSWKSEVNEAMARLSTHFSGMEEPALDHVFGKSGELLTRLTLARKKVQGFVDPDSKDVPDYAISFYGDMVAALNEFIDEYNGFVDRYRLVPNVIPADLLVYLGRTDEDGRKDRNVFRSVFRSALKEEFRKDCRRLSQMLQRVCVLAESFIAKPSDSRLSQHAFQLEKFRPGDCLSSRPVPFYYDSSKEGFLEAWNADKTYACTSAGDADQAYSDRYLRSSGSMNDGGWYLYPRAYQGKAVSVVKGELDALNQDLRLSIDIVEAGLNQVERLSAKDATTLLELLNASSSPAALFDGVRQKCPDNAQAFSLARILGEALDARLVESLRDGRPLADGIYRTVCEAGETDAAALTAMAKAAITVSKTKKIKEQDLSSAFGKLIEAWKNSFVSVVKEVAPEEIGKAISLAPIKRGCRVFLITEPGSGKDAERTVLSYGVVYRNQGETILEEPKGQVVFKMRTKAQVDGVYADDISDTVNPFGDANRWNVEGNKLTLYPFIREGSGSSARTYETAESNVECEIPDDAKGILVLERIKFVENEAVPAVVLKMVGNGSALVTLKVKDGANILCYKKVTINVDNPAWNVVPVSRIVVSPTPIEILKDSSCHFTAQVDPADATEKGIEWKSKDSTIVKVTSSNDTKCAVKALKGGSTQLMAISKWNDSIVGTASIQVSEFNFYVNCVTQSGDGTTTKPLPNTLSPFSSLVDGLKCYVSGSDEIKIDIRKSGHRCDGVEETLDYEIEQGEDIVTCSVVTAKLSSGGNVCYYKLKMGSHKNGTARVTLLVVKNRQVVTSAPITVNVSNPEWAKKPVTGLTLSKFSFSMFKDQVQELKSYVTIQPKDATNSKVSWNSNNQAVAQVVDAGAGQIKALKAGTTRLTVTSLDNSKQSATADLTVYTLSLRVQLKDNGGFEEISPLKVISVAENKYAGGTKVRVYPFKSDGKNPPVRLSPDEVVLIADPAGMGIGHTVRGQQIDSTSEGNFSYATVSWKKGASTASIIAADAKTLQEITKFEVKIK